MFASYKKHNTKLYNKLVELSRNKFFYKELDLSDNFQTRVILIFFHFIVILKTKKNKDFKKVFQNIFDNIFQNIEYSLSNSQSCRPRINILWTLDPFTAY